MAMAEMLGEMFGTVDVQEVRLGLFRIFWKFRNSLNPEDQESLSSALQMKEFKLCGSKMDREFLSSISLAFIGEKTVCLVTVRDVASRRAEDAEEDDPQQHLTDYVQPPSVMWLEGVHTSNSNSDLQYLKKMPRGQWKLMQEVSEIGTVVVLWIDFGTTEVRQTSMIHGLAEMFHTQTQCDAHFKFKNGQSIGAHVVILSAASPVFSALFQSNFKDSLTREVFIEDIDMQVFQYFLQYLYTCRIPRLPEDENFEKTVKSLYQAADKYIVEDLKKECYQLLKEYQYSD
jgi:hypothetical protein